MAVNSLLSTVRSLFKSNTWKWIKFGSFSISNIYRNQRKKRNEKEVSSNKEYGERISKANVINILAGEVAMAEIGLVGYSDLQKNSPFSEGAEQVCRHFDLPFAKGFNF